MTTAPPVAERDPADLATLYASIRDKVRSLQQDPDEPVPDPATWAIRTDHDTDAALFEELTFHVFAAGFSRSVVRDKWPALRAAFVGFEPARTAALDGADCARLAQDRALIRNRRKITGTVDNAQRVLDLAAQHGSFRAWLDSHPRTELYRLHQDIAKRFACAGPSASQWFLLTSGFDYYMSSPHTLRLLKRLGLLGQARAPAVNDVMLRLSAASGENLWRISADLMRFASGFMFPDSSPFCLSLKYLCPGATPSKARLSCLRPNSFLTIDGDLSVLTYNSVRGPSTLTAVCLSHSPVLKRNAPIAWATFLAA